jgi:hypothetical protein
MPGNPFRSALGPRVEGLELLQQRVTEELEAAKSISAVDGHPSEELRARYIEAHAATEAAEQAVFIASLDLFMLISVARQLDGEEKPRGDA